MFNFFRKLFYKTPNTGVVSDPRPLEEKSKDYQAEEIAAFAPVTWVEKTPDQFKKFPIRNQDGSLTCVAQATAKLLGVENVKEENNFVVFSARDIYDLRSNKPDGGMYGMEALNIASKNGSTTEERLPSQNMNEAAINLPFVRTTEDLAIEQKYKAGGYVTMPFDIEAIASVINQGKAVLLFFFFNSSEWTDVPTVNDLELNQYRALRHGVAGVDFTLYKGEKALVIDDSWGTFFGLKGQRIITESFFNKRCFFAGYLLDLSNDWILEPQKPKHNFTKALTFGMKNDSDVRALQDILKYEKLFPQNVVSTGNYLQITAKGVLAFQRKYQVASEKELKSLGGNRVGSKTVAKLNELYS